MYAMKKILTELLFSVLLFLGIFYATLQVDWMKLFNLSPTIVGDRLAEWVWDLTYNDLHEVKSDDVCLPIDTLVREMCLANDIDTASVNVLVSRNSDVNAFVTVGRHLVVYTGLIEKMDNESQLCAVIGHELAHLELGHVQSGIRRQAVFQAILILLTGNSNVDGLIKLTGRMLSNTISRAKENDADAEGARYLHAMHLDPMEMANSLEKLESYGVLSYLSDHADSKDRAARIRKMQFKSNGPFRQILMPETWNTLKSHCE